jgi:hypothetical protein
MYDMVSLIFTPAYATYFGWIGHSKQSNNQTIKQSNNQEIKQSNNKAIKHLDHTEICAGLIQLTNY